MAALALGDYVVRLSRYPLPVLSHDTEILERRHKLTLSIWLGWFLNKRKEIVNDSTPF